MAPKTATSTLPVHELTIPDALLAWGSDPKICLSWPRPWAQEVAELVARAAKAPLEPEATERLLDALDALCACAARQGRHDLLAGIDMLSAEWLNMTYVFERGGRRVTLGRNGTWTYQEMRLVLAQDDPAEALRRAEVVKDLIGDVFPNAQIGGMMSVDEEGDPSWECAGCGDRENPVMLSTDTGGQICGSCYSQVRAPWPKVEKRKSKGKR